MPIFLKPKIVLKLEFLKKIVDYVFNSQSISKFMNFLKFVKII